MFLQCMGFPGGGHQARMRAQESGPRVSYLTMRPVAMQRSCTDALRLVTSLPRCSLKSVSVAQSRALSSITCSKVHEDPPSPPTKPDLLLQTRCMRSCYEKTVITKDKAAQNSFIMGILESPIIILIIRNKQKIKYHQNYF